MSSHRTKDNQWLQVEVCQEFLNGNCAKLNCNYAHPSANVEISQGKVVTCFDSIKAKCRRGACKFFHPSSHLIELMFSKAKSTAAVHNQSHPQVPTPTSVQLMPFFNYSPANHQPAPVQITPLSLFDASPIETPALRPEKRAAEVPVDAIAEAFYPSLFLKRLQLSHLAFSYPIMAMPSTSTVTETATMPIPIATPNESLKSIALNAAFVNYTDDNGEILDQLPVCQDFARNMCTRINCKFVHLQEPKRFEMTDNKVSVCRDHVYGICKRSRCKYYHIPIQIPPKA